MIRLVTEISKDQRHWRNDETISKWTRGSDLLCEEDQAIWLEKIRSDPTIQMFGVLFEPDSKKLWPMGGMTFREKETIVGTAGLTSIDWRNRKAEFSLLIGPEHQRKGYGRQALKELLKYGFNRGLNRIYGETFVYPDEVNPAWKMFEALGFKKEGEHKETYFKEGMWIDSWSFAILARDFNA